MRTREEIEKGTTATSGKGTIYQMESLEWRTLEVLLDIRELLLNKKDAGINLPCLHNFVSIPCPGAWGGSVPPPTMVCTKCGKRI